MHLVVVARELGSSEEHGWIRVIQTDQIVPLVVTATRRIVSDSYLRVVPTHVAAETPKLCSCRLQRALAQRASRCVVELARQQEGHGPNGNLIAGRGGQQEAVEHALLVDSAGALLERLCPETNHVKVG